MHRTMISIAAALVALAAGSAAATAEPTQPGAALQALAARDPVLAGRLAAQRAMLRALSAGPSAAVPATAPPTISAGKILTPTVSVLRSPATPLIRFTYSAPGALALIGYTFQSPAGTFYTVGYAPELPVDTGGTIEVEDAVLPMSLYSEPGTWTLLDVVIDDDLGQITLYSGAQLSAILPSTTIGVTNSNRPDVVAPTASAGSILTPTVSAGSSTPYFEAKLTVADNVSGVDIADVGLQGPGGIIAGASGQPSSPILSGSLIAGLNMSAYAGSLGTWTITSLDVCDIAGNCLLDTSPADIKALFGTVTFTVTR